jgi:hypothetical protein
MYYDYLDHTIWRSPQVPRNATETSENILNKERIVNEKSVKELETTLSSLNSKTCNYNKFKTYCIEKNKVNY